MRFDCYGYSDECSCVWFLLENQNETIESTLADSLRTGVQDADTEHSRDSITRVNNTWHLPVRSILTMSYTSVVQLQVRHSFSAGRGSIQEKSSNMKFFEKRVK